MKKYVLSGQTLMTGLAVFSQIEIYGFQGRLCPSGVILIKPSRFGNFSSCFIVSFFYIFDINVKKLFTLAFKQILVYVLTCLENHFHDFFFSLIADYFYSVLPSWKRYRAVF